MTSAYSAEYGIVAHRTVRCATVSCVPKADLPDVYEYLDYRAYLRGFYLAKKQEGRGFSYRLFSRRADVAAPNYLKLVMEGKRNLSPKLAEGFARACGLDPEASRYFVHLVAFNQSATAAERAEHYGRLTSFQRYRQAQKLDIAHAAYYSEWYIPAIRELAAAADFREDPVWLAAQMLPTITPLQAKRGLETLVALGLLVRDDDGRLKQSESLLSTGPETRGLHIGAFHRAMTSRALESIDLVPADERDISALTLCVRRGGLAALKKRVQRFRRELLELSALESEPEQVVQLNFQLFPLTRSRKGRGR